MAPADDALDDLVLDRRRVIPAAALEERFTTSRGPGGQHVNRTATAVELRLDLAASGLPDGDVARLRERLASRISKEGILAVTASDERSQRQNRLAARGRLRALLRGALRRQALRRPTRPSTAARRRRVEDKRRRGQRKAERARRHREE
jgi:ribosome-associated protein